MAHLEHKLSMSSVPTFPMRICHQSEKQMKKITTGITTSTQLLGSVTLTPFC